MVRQFSRLLVHSNFWAGMLLRGYHGDIRTSVGDSTPMRRSAHDLFKAVVYPPGGILVDFESIKTSSMTARSSTHFVIGPGASEKSLMGTMPLVGARLIVGLIV